MRRRHICSIVVVFLTLVVSVRAQESQPSARQLLLGALTKWADLVEGNTDSPPRTLVANLKLLKSDGLPRELENLAVDFAIQAPDRVRIGATAADFAISVGRNKDVLWVNEPWKKFAVLGKPGVPFFKAEPEKLDQTDIGPFALPISRLKLAMLPYVLDVQQGPSEEIDGAACDVLRIGMLPQAVELLGLSRGHAKLWLRHADLLPVRITYEDGERADVRVDITHVSLEKPWADEKWQLHAAADEHVETTAVSHLMKFIHVAPKV
jgi:hypothetical protein